MIARQDFNEVYSQVKDRFGVAMGSVHRRSSNRAKLTFQSKPKPHEITEESLAGLLSGSRSGG